MGILFERRWPSMGVSLLAGVMALASVQVQARPPQAAFSACDAKSEGSSCAISTPHGSLTGQCRSDRRGNGLLCVPECGGKPPESSGTQAGGAKDGERQGPGGRTREHTETQSSGELTLYPANTAPITDSESDSMISGRWRILTANGVSEHNTGAFPNRGNPHGISEQNYELKVPAQPQLTGRITPLGHNNFGLSVQGVPFDPGAAEWYKGIRSSKWQYEPLAGVLALGLDANHAHVQPTGAYHYHGMPNGLLEDLELNSREHSPLIGWAADGFPIYALHGFANGDSGEVGEQTSSYRLKQGPRPSGDSNPGGRYDGTFVGDYEFVDGSGSLDECNGRWTKTPEFPQGTYAYFITHSWPVIPRCHKGTPSSDFKKGRR